MLRNFIFFSLLFLDFLSLLLLERLALLLEIFWPEDLPNFRGSFPARPVHAMQFHEFFRSFDGFLFGLKIEDCESADDFFTFSERTVDGCALAVGNTNVGTGGDWRESASGHHSTGLVCLGGKFLHRIHQSLWWSSGELLSVLDQHHESHLYVSFCAYVVLTAPR